MAAVEIPEEFMAFFDGVSAMIAELRARIDMTLSLVEKNGLIDKESNILINRIDYRQRNDVRRCRFPIFLQEIAFNYWQLGLANPAIRFSRSGKIRYCDVYDYYKKELRSFGIYSAELFRKILRARHQRIYSSQLNECVMKENVSLLTNSKI